MVAIHEKNWTAAEKIKRTIGHKEGEADIFGITYPLFKFMLCSLNYQ
jgi:hypothetical protein